LGFTSLNLKEVLFMARPDKFPEWARVPYVDPVVGGSNIVEPPEQQKDDGWLRKQKPPAQYTNYLFNKIDEWLKYLDSNTPNYAVTTGTQPNYIVTIPGITAYEDGLTLILFIHAANASGAATVNLNGIGAKNLVGSNGSVFAANDLGLSLIYTFTYQGSEFILSNTQPASTASRGLIRIATATEVKTATDDSKAVVPTTMKVHQGIAKVWAIFKWTGSAVQIDDSYGISSITRTATGRYAVNFSTTFATNKFCVSGSVHDPTLAGGVAFDNPLVITTNSADIAFYAYTAGALIDPDLYGCVIFHGTLA